MNFKGFLVPEESNSYLKLNLSENVLKLLKTNYTEEKSHFLILLNAFVSFIEGQLTNIIVIYIKYTT